MPAFGAARRKADDLTAAEGFALLGVFPDRMNVVVEMRRKAFADCVDLGNNRVRTEWHCREPKNAPRGG